MKITFINQEDRTLKSVPEGSVFEIIGSPTHTLFIKMGKNKVRYFYIGSHFACGDELKNVGDVPVKVVGAIKIEP